MDDGDPHDFFKFYLLVFFLLLGYLDTGMLSTNYWSNAASALAFYNLAQRPLYNLVLWGRLQGDSVVLHLRNRYIYDADAN